VDDCEVVPEEPAKSIGAETTFMDDTSDLSVIQKTILKLANRVGSRLRADGVQAKTLTLKFRTAKFQTFTRGITLQEPTDQDSAIYHVVLTLFERLPCANEKARLLGIAGSHLIKPEDSRQLALFSLTEEPNAQITKAVDAIRARFGDQAIQPATLFSKVNSDE